MAGSLKGPRTNTIARGVSPLPFEGCPGRVELVESPSLGVKEQQECCTNIRTIFE